MKEPDSPQTDLLAEIQQLRARVADLEQDSTRLQALLSNLASIVAVGDSAGRFAYVSPQVQDILGVSPQEVEGQFFHEWIHPEDLPLLLEAMGKALEGEPVFNVQYRVRHAKGHYVNISASGRLVHEDGEVHVVAVLTDISRQVSDELRLQRLSTALEQSSDAIILCDLNGLIVEANEAALELFGAETDKELIGKSSFDFVVTDDADKAHRDMAEIIEKGELRDVETRFKNRRGEEVLVGLNLSTISAPDGTASGVVGMLRDLTEQRKIQDELLKARKLESIGLLAGGIAHDFNNVLSAILGNLNVARARCDHDNNVLPLLVDAEKATLRARKLTQRLLTFARGGEPVKSVASISTLLDDALSATVPDHGRPPRIVLPEDLWAVDVDPEQMRQAFEHLLRNALTASKDDGPVSIHATNVQIRESSGSLLAGSYVQVAFEDHGPAIPPEQRADVFDPYFGAKNTETALALATAFSIASRHGGTITVDSALDAGSVFAIYLPASLSPTQEHALQKTRIAGEGRRILVMDDERIVRRVARRMLESMDFEVTLAEHGEEAIEQFESARAQSTPFHAVMLDLTVPEGLGGRDTLTQLRKIDPEVSAIVASGYSDDAVMANYSDHGFRAVLAKPYQLAELAAALHRALDSRRPG